MTFRVLNGLEPAYINSHMSKGIQRLFSVKCLFGEANIACMSDMYRLGIYDPQHGTYFKYHRLSWLPHLLFLSPYHLELTPWVYSHQQLIVLAIYFSVWRHVINRIFGLFYILINLPLDHLKPKSRPRRPFGRAVCGKRSYNPTFDMCCGGTVRSRLGLRPACCGTQVYDATFDRCCGGRVC